MATKGAEQLAFRRHDKQTEEEQALILGPEEKTVDPRTTLFREWT